MRFYSTKNKNRFYSLKDAVLLGLPEDNGLFMPEFIPVLDDAFINSLQGMSLVDIAAAVSKAWFAEDIPSAVLEELVMDAFNFDTPLVQVDEQTWVEELFYGPTLAFKDVGARFMARLMSWLVRDSNKKLTILVATSGDTGSAVASGFFGLENIEVIILYPSGKVSPSQEKQLTTWGGNITALEVGGTFDDCQRMVKEAFLDHDLRSSYQLTSANSINISRLVPQSFYYFRACALLPEGAAPPCFIIPSGNFGNLTAGSLAKRMGLPVSRFIAATNANDVVPSYLSSGVFEPRPSVATISNAMDVGNPSNFWRMTALFGESLDAMKEEVIGFKAGEEETRRAMKACYTQSGYVLEPHGTVGYHAWHALRHNIKAPGVILETAHPSKFPDVVNETLGITPEIPERLAGIFTKEKKSINISLDFAALKAYLMGR